MIRLTENIRYTDIPDTWSGIIVKSRFLSYGTTRSFAPFYEDDNGNILSVLDGNAVLYGTVDNVQEWAVFIAMHPDITTISAEKDSIFLLSQHLKKAYIAKPVMQYHGRLENLNLVVCETLTPREIYPLLCNVFTNLPSFEGWYVDVSHRLRHGLCHTAGMKKDNIAISTAMTIAECEKAAIIGAVATDPNHRKQGLATKCITFLLQQLVLLGEKKTVFICPKNEFAQRLYEHIDFNVCGEIGEINLKD